MFTSQMTLAEIAEKAQLMRDAIGVTIEFLSDKIANEDTLDSQKEHCQNIREREYRKLNKLYGLTDGLYME